MRWLRAWWERVTHPKVTVEFDAFTDKTLDLTRVGENEFETNPTAVKDTEFSQALVDSWQRAQAERLELDWLGEPTLEKTPEVVRYPTPSPYTDKELAQKWVTERLGGIVTDVQKMDLTHLSDAQRVQRAMSKGGGFYARGYSVRYLSSLLRRAERMDNTLTHDELYIIRTRGLL